MEKDIKTITIRIGGMTCVNCQKRIERQLSGTSGVIEARVDYTRGQAVVTWDDSQVNVGALRAAIESLGYKALDGGRGAAAKKEVFATLAVIIALYVIVQFFGIGALTAAFPLAEVGMNGALLFVVGIMTSLHCLAMCGGINLSQCIPTSVSASAADNGGKWRALLPALLYNAGRVVSYTAIGALVGGIGSVISISGRFRGILQIAAGVFMVVMGLNMLGIFPALRRFKLSLPAVFTAKVDAGRRRSNRAFVVGLLNGLMPCGPLQAAQLFALSTGSPLLGGAAMFFFSLGTVPLMFGAGALSSLLAGVKGRVFSRRVLKAGAALVTVMGLTMLTYGATLSGLGAGLSGVTQTNDTKRGVTADVQIVESTLSAGRYPAITVEEGRPVRWTINAPPGSINGCNNRMIIREYGIEHRFTAGDNVIEFLPTRAGKFYYSCWMGMIRSSITVTARGAKDAPPSAENSGTRPAGVTIPTDKIAIAAIANSVQTVTVNLRDEGIEPAVIVFQRGVPARWTINNDSLDEGNSSLIFPAYDAQIDMEQGDNIIELEPTADFDFSTADYVFYGFVKVVNNLAAVDLEAVRAEVGAFETLIYGE